MVGILAHFHVQLHFENRKLFIFWIYFFRENIILYFFSQLQPDPENIDIGTVVDTWLQEFIGFFFHSLWRADDFLFSFFFVYSSCLFTIFFTLSKFRCTLQIVFCVPAMEFTHGLTYRAR